jgi:cell fate regulator YaaT (PSP1 superfamily)
MAFHQGLSFSPGRLTGLCGRLVCCLAYEHEQYCTALKNFPKVGERIEVEGRQGEVTGVNIFRETIAIQWADGTKGELSWPKAR